MLQKNEVYEVEITGVTEEGDGVGRVDSMAVFVPYAICGEKVRVLIVKVLKRFAYGKLLEVLTPSPHRVRAECPHFYQCGGCQLWQMDREGELAMKHQKVADCLLRLGKIQLAPEKVLDCNQMTRYRNKAQYPVTADGIGFYRRNSHQVIPMEDCLLQGEQDRTILRAVREWMEENHISPYCEANHSGEVRHIYLRTGREEILFVIVTATRSLTAKEKLVERLCGLGLPLVGILQNINTEKTNVVLGKEMMTLWGRDYLVDQMDHVKFKISPFSFYQVNRFATRELYRLAEKMADLHGNETVWDLYCGIGTIGQFMARKAGKIIGVEVIPQAVENARENAVLNQIDNAVYHCGSAEKIVPKLVKEGEKADVVILDPPRKGCDEKLLDAVAEIAPDRIVYISCKPSTLARDLACLEAKGYHTERVVPVNMFPRTCHVECCVRLCR